MRWLLLLVLPVLMVLSACVQGNQLEGQAEAVFAEAREKMVKEQVDAENKRIASIDTPPTNSGVDSVNAFDDPVVKAQWDAWVIASKRPAAKANGEDWSKAEFLKTLKHGEVSGRR